MNQPRDSAGSGPLVPDPHVDLLVRYAEATYEAVTGQRRRQARIALAIAVLFGLLACFGALRWADLRDQAAATPDAALVEGLGVTLPDPRPALVRVELRLRAFMYGSAAIGFGGVALLALASWAMVRPPSPPRRIGDDQPPM
jgi:TRAP-type C4-dicarboxylate transport system permease small subunit